MDTGKSIVASKSTFGRHDLTTSKKKSIFRSDASPGSDDSARERFAAEETSAQALCTFYE